MDEHPEIEDCVTMSQFNDMRQNIKDRQNRMDNDLHAILEWLQHLPRGAKNSSNHGDVEETVEEAAERVAREQQERRQRATFHARRPTG
jgi:hypothetical protein